MRTLLRQSRRAFHQGQESLGQKGVWHAGGLTFGAPSHVGDAAALLRPAAIQRGSRGSLVGLFLVYWRPEESCGGCGTGGPVLVVFGCQPAAHPCKLLALRWCP